jgi:lipopolysaccharide transport system ATP-binding protein
MSDIVIKVENLSKKYIIRHQQQERYTALRDVIASGVKNIGKKMFSPFTDFQEAFFSLKDVSFEIKQGDRIGIIGRNGAGKTTLLKILSRITEPTSGRIEITGRVASLLEVGTGFHPELTGRENIFLNGAILGMSKAEIKRKFDEIVDFAEVEKFLDTPVKRYSSGMYVRLAFAVAAHLETEILLVDEILAVGDAQFQTKCLGKMDDVSRKAGRTILFVSHNMAAVKRLCCGALLLDHGYLAIDGDVERVIIEYSGRVKQQVQVQFERRKDKPSITGIKVDEEGLKRGDLIVDVTFKSPFSLSPPVVGLLVNSGSGMPVFGSNPRFHFQGFEWKSLSSGVARMCAKHLPIVDGTYNLSVWLGDWVNDYDSRMDVLSFEFRPETTDVLRPPPEFAGYLDWPAQWEVRNCHPMGSHSR